MGPISLISPIGAVGPEGPISSSRLDIPLRGHYPRTCTKIYFSREYSDVLRFSPRIKNSSGALFLLYSLVFLYCLGGDGSGYFGGVIA